MQTQIILSLFRDCAGPFIIALLFAAAAIFAARKSKALHLLKFSPQSGLLIFYVAIGCFIIRALLWSYTAYHAAILQTPGSFRMNGPLHVISTAQQWHFPKLQMLVEAQWLFPKNKGPIFTKPMPDDGFVRMRDGALEAEHFRRNLFNNNDKPLILLLEKIVNFKEAVHPILDAPYQLDRFDISVKTLTQALERGVSLQNGEKAFQSFAGPWFGLWEKNPVDHEWSQTERFSPPYRIDDGEITLYIHALQYAWIGDGFGWNLLISPETADSNTFILGTVYHVKDHNPNQVYLHRPHAGLAIGDNLIWITAGEVFFEQAYLTRSPQEYAITGFNYEWQNNQIMKKNGGFQAVYSRNADKRIPWRKIQTK